MISGALLIAAAVAAAIAGYHYGRKVGVDEGWIDCELDHLHRDFGRDRARRNKLGQFKGKVAQP